jgi:hypothetical protein
VVVQLKKEMLEDAKGAAGAITRLEAEAKSFVKFKVVFYLS